MKTIKLVTTVLTLGLGLQGLGASELHSAKQLICESFAPGGYEIVDLENKFYCKVGGRQTGITKCTDSALDPRSVTPIQLLREGQMNFDSKYVGFIEIQLKTRALFKIYEPTVAAPAPIKGQYHRAEMGYSDLVTGPFEPLSYKGFQYGCRVAN